MKQVFSIVFAVTLLLSLAGCKKNSADLKSAESKSSSFRSEVEFEGDEITEVPSTTKEDETTDELVPEAPSLRSEEDEVKKGNSSTTVPQLKKEPIPEEGNIASEDDFEYTALINDLKRIVQFRLSDYYSINADIPMSTETKNAVSFNSDNEYKWSSMISELPGYPEPEDINCYGYILHDLNADGQKELFFMKQDHTIAAIFTVYNSRVVLLDAYWSRYSGHISETGDLYSDGSGGAAYSTTKYYNISDGKIFPYLSFYTDLDEYNNVCYYMDENGKVSRITKEQYNEGLSGNKYDEGDFWNSIPVQPLY